MILFALAAAAAAQWTGPHTEEYRGPGYFCGGGYAIRLARGDRALILPQGQERRARASSWAGVRSTSGPALRARRGPSWPVTAAPR
jgi:hypothetical protein